MGKQMRTKDAKSVPTGNSKRDRIPKALLRKKDNGKLSWEDTFKAMADEKENWDDFDTTLLDGLDDGYFG